MAFTENTENEPFKSWSRTIAYDLGRSNINISGLKTIYYFDPGHPRHSCHE
jgi:hypothetical protein